MKKADFLSTLNTLNESHKLPKGYVEELNNLVAQYATARINKEEHPAIKDDEGNITELWCNKHLQYELVAEFATSTKGKDGYHNKCKIADYQWRFYLKEIKRIEDEMTKAIDEERFEDVANLNKDKKQAIILKDGAYPSKDELSNEELEQILPKQKEI